jgi:anti-sigma regulatory factor (Ser/Thr protein kinase)
MSACARLVGRKRFPRAALKSCTLALIEAVDNAIFHAHLHKKDKWIDIFVEIKKGSIVIGVADHGKGLNHIEIRNPGLTATRGRGLYLMEQLMDSVESRFSGKKHEMILTYRL